MAELAELSHAAYTPGAGPNVHGLGPHSTGDLVGRLAMLRRKRIDALREFLDIIQARA